VEQSLRERLRAGEAQAFGELFDEHAAAVYRHGLRLTGDRLAAEDVVSTTFLHAWRQRHRIDRDGGSLLPWLLGIATNVVRNLDRRHRRDRSLLARLSPREEAPDVADDVAAQLDGERELAAVRAALATLRPAEREVIALCVWAELDYASAAAALGVPIGTVRSRLARARRKLMRLRGEPGPEPGQVHSGRPIVASRPTRRLSMTDDVRAIARLLPDPARPEPPEGRLHRLRETLMEQITQDQTDTQDRAASAEAPATLPSPRRRRRLIPALVGGGMAFVLALWLTSAFVFGVGKVWAGRTEAGALLHRIALVAATSTDIPPLDQIRDDQYVYIETYGSRGGFGLTHPNGPAGWFTEGPQRRQIWLSVDGSRPGLLREESYHEDVQLDANPDPYLHYPTLRYLATLPTDPDLLLLKIYWENGDMGPNPQQEAFVTIGDLIREQIVSPDVAKALYQAAARIPGIEVVHDVEDALGRPGIAIARTHNNIRHELIFDKNTLQFLGERSVATGPLEGPVAENGSPAPPAPEGFVLVSIAVVARAIVDAPGQVPGE